MDSGTATEAGAPPTLLSTATVEGTAGFGGIIDGRGGVEVAIAISPPGGCGKFAPPDGGDPVLMAPDGTGGLTEGASLTVAPDGWLGAFAGAVLRLVLPEVAAG